MQPMVNNTFYMSSHTGNKDKIHANHQNTTPKHVDLDMHNDHESELYSLNTPKRSCTPHEEYYNSKIDFDVDDWKFKC